MPPSDFKTRRQIADLYPIPYSTLKKFGMRENSGGPPVIRIGSSIYYHVPSFEKWLLSYLGTSPDLSQISGKDLKRRGRPTKAEIVERRRRRTLSNSVSGPRPSANDPAQGLSDENQRP